MPSMSWDEFLVPRSNVDHADGDKQKILYQRPIIVVTKSVSCATMPRFCQSVSPKYVFSVRFPGHYARYSMLHYDQKYLEFA